jgi:hypothetical protein
MTGAVLTTKTQRHKALSQTLAINFVLACEAGNSVESGAQAPGKDRPDLRARENGRQQLILGFRPLRGLRTSNPQFPVAHAPGFTLPPAPQAKQDRSMK